MTKIKKPHYPYRGNIRALTQQEVGGLLEQLRSSAPPNVALAAWTQYETASRIREVLHLTTSNVLANGVFVARLKGSNDTHISVSSLLLTTLQELAARTKPQGYLFKGNSTCRQKRKDGTPFPCKGGHLAPATIFRYVQKAGRAVGIDISLCRTHVMRHSGITHVAEVNEGEPLNVTLRRLSEFSGHKNLEHLLHYLSNPREDRAYENRRATAFAAVTAPHAPHRK